LFILKHFPALLLTRTTTFRPDCARINHWTVAVHIGAVKRASATAGVISLARRLSFSKASRFICSFISQARR